MKKFVAIVLALMLMLSCVACSGNMTTAEFQKEYQQFDWDGATDSQAKTEANRLIGELEKMPTSMQTELAEIREDLEEHASGAKSEMTPDDGVLPEEMMPEGILPDDMMPDGENGMEDNSEIMPEDDGMMKDDGMEFGRNIPNSDMRRHKLSHDIAPAIGRKNKTQAPNATEVPDEINGEVKKGEGRNGERAGRPHHERVENGERPQLENSERPSKEEIERRGGKHEHPRRGDVKVKEEVKVEEN